MGFGTAVLTDTSVANVNIAACDGKFLCVSGHHFEVEAVSSCCPLSESTPIDGR
jgi:hypothetical protein